MQSWINAFLKIAPNWQLSCLYKFRSSLVISVENEMVKSWKGEGGGYSQNLFVSKGLPSFHPQGLKQ